MSFPFIDWLFSERDSIAVRRLYVDSPYNDGGNFNDPAALQEVVADWDADPRTKGVYFFTNPTTKDITNNSEPGWQSGDGRSYAHKHMLLLDFDIPGKDGTATVSELAACEAVTVKVMEYLSDGGAPSPVVGESGSGWHLLYRIEPDTSTETVQCFVRSLKSRFDTEEISLDMMPTNANSLSRLYGTVSRKGGQNRMTDFAPPDTFEPLPTGLLAENQLRPPRGRPRARLTGITGEHPIETYLTRFKLLPQARETDNTPHGEPAVMYEFEECPIRKHGRGLADGHHTSGPFKASAWQVYKSDGTLGALNATCLSSKCKEWIEEQIADPKMTHITCGWHALRYLFDDVPKDNLPRHPTAAQAMDWMNKHFGRWLVHHEPRVLDLKSGQKKTTSWLKARVSGTYRVRVQRPDGDTDSPPYEDRPIVPLWLSQCASENPDYPMRRYLTETFAPGVDDLPAHVFNHWQGYAVAEFVKNGATPKDKCRLFLEHTRDVICAGNESHYDILIKWLAYIIQHGNIKAAVAVVVRSMPGAGKSCWLDYFGDIFGQHYFVVNNSDAVQAAHNDWMSNKQVIVFNEALWAGGKKQRSMLKALISESYTAINEKYCNQTTVPNRANVFVFTNYDHAFPVEENDRRAFCLHASPHRITDGDYFRAFKSERDNDGASALLAHLQGIDLSQFDPHQKSTFPITNEKINQLELTQSLLSEFWQACLEAGSTDGYIDADHPRWIEDKANRLGTFKDQFKEKTGQHIHHGTLKRFLISMGGMHTPRGFVWRSLDWHRAKFFEVTGINPDWAESQNESKHVATTA